MKLTLLLSIVASLAGAQVTIPEGIKIRVRLDQTISSATAEQGQAIELSVVEPIKVGEVTVIPAGSRVTGTITEAKEKRRMGRAGKLDFSIDRVKAIDDQWVNLRYTLTKKSGDSHAVRTGLITAGVAFAFLPAAPVALLMKGKDVVLNKGVNFDVYTDSNYALKLRALATPPPATSTAPTHPPSSAPPAATHSGTATVTVTSTVAGAEIEVDGAFVGSTPTTLQVDSGSHRIVVKANNAMWDRTVSVTAGSAVSLNAILK